MAGTGMATALLVVVVEADLSEISDESEYRVPGRESALVLNCSMVLLSSLSHPDISAAESASTYQFFSPGQVIWRQ